jgi:hypothetical protein
MSNITDLQRHEFFQALDKDVRSVNGLVLNEWEQNFLSSWRQSSRPTLWFTEGRRKAVDRMWSKLGDELNHRFPLAETSAPATPKADAHCCMFLKRDDERRLVPCNEPAEMIGRNGFLYCRACAEEAKKNMKRNNINISLQPYQAK